jgi:hypothetical protein
LGNRNQELEPAEEGESVGFVRCSAWQLLLIFWRMSSPLFSPGVCGCVMPGELFTWGSIVNRRGANPAQPTGHGRQGLASLQRQDLAGQPVGGLFLTV